MKNLPPISEEQFQKQVIELAHLLNWRCCHFRPSMNRSGKWSTAVQADGAGFPDLVLVRHKVIYAEVKAERGKLSPGQEKWRDWLLLSGQEWYMWKPSDWGLIEEVLA